MSNEETTRAGNPRRRQPRVFARRRIGSAINAPRSREDRDRKRRIHTAASRRRDLSAARLVFFLFPPPSTPFLLSSARSPACRSLRGKPPAEMRRAATREWNIIAQELLSLRSL